jgi:outer membrane protein assembly factor BamE (lipoprotein component of BamABCDE complex)
MKIIKYLTSLLLAVSPSVNSTPGALFSLREISVYPFVASAERANTIKKQYKRVIPGMMPDTVIEILGEPDEVRVLYAPVVKHPKRIGYTYWYVIRRETLKGSVDERDEVLVRVSFDKNGRVFQIVHWGFDDSD